MDGLQEIMWIIYVSLRYVKSWNVLLGESWWKVNPMSFCRYMCMNVFRQSSQRNPCQRCGGNLPAPSVPQDQPSSSVAHSGNWQILSRGKTGLNDLQIKQHNFYQTLWQRQKKKLLYSWIPHHIHPERLHRYCWALLPTHACCEDACCRLDSHEDWTSSKNWTWRGRPSLPTLKLLGYLSQEGQAAARNLVLLSSSQHQIPSNCPLSWSKDGIKELNAGSPLNLIF